MLVETTLQVLVTITIEGRYVPSRKATIPRGEYRALEPDDPPSIEDAEVTAIAAISPATASQRELFSAIERAIFEDHGDEIEEALLEAAEV